MTLIQNMLGGLLLSLSLSMPVLAGFWPFSTPNAIDQALTDQQLELKINHALLKNITLRDHADIHVLSFNKVILITGNADNQATRQLAIKIVLDTTGVKKTGEDRSQVRPNNESTCKQKKKALYNERRRFNLKNSQACTKISHVYDKTQIREPIATANRGHNWIQTAQIKAELLKRGVLEHNHEPMLKVISFERVVYLLGRREQSAEQIIAWVKSITGVKRVIPLWIE